LPLTLNEIANDFTHGVSHEILVIQDAMNCCGDVLRRLAPSRCSASRSPNDATLSGSRTLSFWKIRSSFG
jgi:hypothetical protein